MKHLILSLILASAAPLPGGGLNPAQVPASAKWRVHFDLEAMRDSESGRAVIGGLEAEHAEGFGSFTELFRFRIFSDVRGITLYGDGLPDHAVLLVDGRFDRAHIEGVLKHAEGYSVADHGTVAVHSWLDKDVRQHAALPSDALLVFSHQEDLLRQGLDALARNVAAEETDPFLAAGGRRPLVVAAAELSEIEITGDEARVLRLSRSIRLTADERDGRFTLRGRIGTANVADADRLRRMIDGLIAMLEVGDPKFETLDLRAGLEVTRESPGLEVELSLPSGEWIAMLRDQTEGKE